MHDLTGFQRDILYVIAGLDAPMGLAIKDVLDEYYQENLHHTRLYQNLDILVEKGLVDVDKRGLENNYILTEQGRQELIARRDWEPATTGKKPGELTSHPHASE